MCGKDSFQKVFLRVALGSPPRVRERPRVFKRLLSAGEDHPRVCGKDDNINDPNITLSGSPPRVRERLCRLTLLKLLAGITPACAGKTDRFCYCDTDSRITPACAGKTLLKRKRKKRQSGSPPRVRERPDFKGLDRTQSRITPACAGKTNNAPNLFSEHQDHPRVCGKDQVN